MAERKNKNRIERRSRSRKNIATKLLLLLILMTLVPVGITAILMLATTRHIQKVSLDEGKGALIEKFESYISSSTRDYAEGLSRELLRIEGEARAVASVAAMLYTHPENFRLNRSRKYSFHELGFFYSPLEEGSNLFATSALEVTGDFLEEVLLTEHLDPPPAGSRGAHPGSMQKKRYSEEHFPLTSMWRVIPSTSSPNLFTIRTGRLSGQRCTRMLPGGDSWSPAPILSMRRTDASAG
jgi:hypothetical protein